MTFHDVAREQLRIARADRVDEVLIVRILDRRETRRLVAFTGMRIRSRTLLVLRSEVGLPFLPCFFDPQPALRAVEELAASHSGFGSRAPATRPRSHHCSIAGH